jgi:hypothetical protein
MRSNSSIMKIGSLALTLYYVSACGKYVDHKYAVASRDVPVAVSSFNCGKGYPGFVKDHVAFGHIQARCDGPMMIQVRYDRYVTICKVGYVSYGETPKLWRFIVINRQCTLQSAD